MRTPQKIRRIRTKFTYYQGCGFQGNLLKIHGSAMKMCPCKIQLKVGSFGAGHSNTTNFLHQPNHGIYG
jgi:hypothetical protein